MSVSFGQRAPLAAQNDARTRSAQAKWTAHEDRLNDTSVFVLPASAARHNPEAPAATSVFDETAAQRRHKIVISRARLGA